MFGQSSTLFIEGSLADTSVGIHTGEGSERYVTGCWLAEVGNRVDVNTTCGTLLRGLLAGRNNW